VHATRDNLYADLAWRRGNGRSLDAATMSDPDATIRSRNLLSKFVMDTGQKLDAKEADPAHLPDLKDAMLKWLRNGDVKRTPDDFAGNKLDKFEKVMRTMMEWQEQRSQGSVAGGLAPG
jgi:hypothetical protein